MKRLTVAFRPKVHGVSPVTSIVHWVSCSFLGNHDKITIKGNTTVAGLKIFAFLGLFGSKIAPSPVTETKIVHSQARVTRHLNLWSKSYSTLLFFFFVL
jgi:hypothetical protein